MASSSAVEHEQVLFNAFHSIDRRLYSRLVFDLNRDPAESAQVMALWLWLEQSRLPHLNFIPKLLSQYPDALLCAVADESLLALRCADTHSPPAADIPLLRSAAEAGPLTLRFFFDNRVGVIRGVARVFHQVCSRAFRDIHQHALLPAGGHFGHFNVPRVDDPSDADDCGPVDDRTIFLTFSKGYPISEFELRGFITDTFGDVVDHIYMQEVPPDDQPLYARLVARSADDIGVVLSGKSRAKFSINGKHVWARKYVRKHTKSPRKLPSQPASPSDRTTPTLQL